jgi:hypothetical protein
VRQAVRGRLTTEAGASGDSTALAAGQSVSTHTPLVQRKGDRGATTDADANDWHSAWVHLATGVRTACLSTAHHPTQASADEAAIRLQLDGQNRRNGVRE